MYAGYGDQDYKTFKHSWLGSGSLEGGESSPANWLVKGGGLLSDVFGYEAFAQKIVDVKDSVVDRISDLAAEGLQEINARIVQSLDQQDSEGYDKQDWIRLGKLENHLSTLNKGLLFNPENNKKLYRANFEYLAEVCHDTKRTFEEVADRVNDADNGKVVPHSVAGSPFKTKNKQKIEGSDFWIKPSDQKKLVNFEPEVVNCLAEGVALFLSMLSFICF